MSRVIRLAVLVGFSALIGCDASSSNHVDGGASFYAGAGSEWTAQVNTNRTVMLLHFPTLGDPTADQLINADATLQSTGLTGLAVTSSAGSGPPAEGAAGEAIEAPGTMLVLAPFSGGVLVPMVSAGECPSAAMAANLVKVKPASGWTAAASDASALFVYDPASGVATMPARYALGDATHPIAGGALALGAGSCAGGIVTPSGGAELFVSASGAVVVHTQAAAEPQAGDEIYVGLPAASAMVMPAELAGDYAGFLYVSDAATTNAVVQLSLAASGTSVGGTSVAVDGSALDVTVALAAPGAADGLLVGTIATSGATTGGAPQPLACIAQPAANGSQPLIACAGASASGGFVSLILAGR